MTLPALTTEQQIRDADTDELAAALRAAAGPEDNARRGAVHALVEYNGGSLIRLAAIRAYIVPAGGTDGPLVQWSRLGRHLADITHPDFEPLHLHDDDPRNLLRRVNSTALDALRFAVTLGDGTYATNLRSICGRAGRVNRMALAEALLMALGITEPVSAPNGRTDPGA